MMKRLGWNGGFILILCLLLCLISASSQTAPIVLNAGTDQKFSDDSRLHRTIDVNETGIALEDLLKSVSTSSLKLTCDHACADQKLQLRLHKRPLYNLMSALAELLPGTWEPTLDHSGYILVSSANSGRLRDRWWEIFLEEREQVLHAQADALIARMRADPKNAGTVENASPGDVQPADTQKLFNSLPEALQTRIASNIDDSSFYAATPSAYNLGDNEGATLVAFSDLPTEAQKILTTQNADRTGGKSDLPAQTWMRFVNTGYQIYAILIDSASNPAVSSHTLPGLPGMEGAANMNMLSMKHADLPATVKAMGRNAPSNLKILAEYQARTFWKNDPPADRTTWIDRSLVQELPRRAPVLAWLADKGQFDFVADYYSQPGVALTPEQQAKQLTHPLKEELNVWAAELDMSWKQQGDLYLFRNNRWYRDDRLEVPAPLAKKWLQKLTSTQPVKAQGALSLRTQIERDIEFATNLSRFQIANGLQWLALENLKIEQRRSFYYPYWEFPFRDDAIHTMGHYNIARFYASLDAEERDLIWQKQLPLSRLNAMQRAQAEYLEPMLQIQTANHPASEVLLGFAPTGVLKMKTGLVFTQP